MSTSKQVAIAMPTDKLPDIIRSEEQAVWESFTDKKQATAMSWLRLINVINDFTVVGISRSQAVKTLLSGVKSNRLSPPVIKAALSLGRGGSCVSKSAILGKYKAYKEKGLLGLVPQHKGSVRKVWGWEARAIHYHNLPSAVDKAAVADWLRQDGFETATEERVRSYIKSLPMDVQEGRQRVGPKLWLNTRKGYNVRDTTVLPVGHVWQGDGHTLDIYLKHPTGDKPWRAELTAWMDIRSRYIPGWWISEAESAESTLFALSYSITKHDHIPALLHIDNGSGYKNHMMSDNSLGFYDRLGIDIMHSIAYNAKGKGQIERFFGTLERKLNKRFPGYCGADMSEEFKQAYLKRVAKGQERLMELGAYVGKLTDWVEHYNNTPHRGLNGKTPAEVWATLKHHKVEPKGYALFQPREVRTVRRTMIHIHNRQYINPELVSYDKKELVIEYSLFNDQTIRVLEPDGRWICDAELVKKIDYLPASRIEEGKQKRLKASLKRKQIHIDEDIKRARLNITHEDVVNELSMMNESLEKNTSVITEQFEDELLSANSSSLLTDSEEYLCIDPLDLDY